MAVIRIDGPTSEAVTMIDRRIQELAAADTEREQGRRDGMIEAVSLIMVALAGGRQTIAAPQLARSNGYTSET
jgi:hypothetical protein